MWGIIFVFILLGIANGLIFYLLKRMASYIERLSENQYKLTVELNSLRDDLNTMSPLHVKEKK